MHEISCPHCGKPLKVDETGYADLLKQVRDDEFDRRLELAEQDKQNAVALAEIKAASLSQKVAADKDAEILKLQAAIEAGETTRKLAVTEAFTPVEKQRDTLATELRLAKQERESAVELATTKAVSEAQKDFTAKDVSSHDLQAKLDAGDSSGSSPSPKQRAP